jgi:hypothetical protein
MSVLFWTFAVLAFWLYVEKRREAFTLEFKTSLDGKVLKSANFGVGHVLKGVKNQAAGLTNSLVSVLPFKEKMRQMHRRWRRKNM